MRKLSALLSLVAVLVVTACNDTATGPNGLTPSTKVTNTPIPGSCTTLSALTSLAGQVFGSGSPNVQAVIGKLNNLDQALHKGDVSTAQSRALDIVSFIQQKAGQGRLAGTPSQIDVFIGGVLCYAGLLPNTFLVQPTDDAQIIKTNDGNGGLSLGPHTVGVPTLVTITVLDPNGPSGLNTKLDQYPSFITITASSPLTTPAVIAVCIPASLGVPADVFARLRLGHQKTSGFEITPPADPSFLGCSTTTAASKTPGWLRTLASVFLPTKAYARTMMESGGGVGGSSTELSPFGPVDDGLFAGGGVGGSSTELNVTRDALPNTPGSTSKPRNGTKPSFSLYDIDGNCISADTTVGTQLSPKCRPVVTVKTGKGTLLTGVPLSWAVTAGGGTIAPANLATDACGTFASSTANVTDVNGKAGVCWTMGPNAGANTVQATPTAGGDAPAGVIFLNSSGAQESGVQFTATGDLIPTTAGATGASVPYDGLQHPGSGTCSNGLTPALTYNTPGGVVPVNAGSFTLTVTCGTGSTVYAVSTATAPVSITQRAATATASSASMTFGGTVPALSCAVTGLTAADAAAHTVTCTSSVGTLVAGANTVTPVVSPSAPQNYAVTPVNGTLTVHYQQVDCFEDDEGLRDTPPAVSDFQQRGVAVRVECGIMNSTGHQVAGAIGDLTVLDMGTTSAGPGTLFLQVNNAMSPDNDTDGDGDVEYAYTLSTSTMTSGHYYKVTVSWNDGTTTVGWMYVKQI